MPTADVSSGPPAVDGQLMNILTADSGRVSEVSVYLDRLYYLPLSLGIGIWYMYELLGVSALVGLSFAALYAPLTKTMFVWLTDIEKKAKAMSDRRISVITEIVQGIKAVKLFGWESRFLESVDKQRESQLVYFWKALVWRVYIGAVAALGPMLILIIIFTTYVAILGNTLTAEVAFTSISVFQSIRFIFGHLPSHLSWCITGYVSLGRIDSFLGQPQVQALEDRVAQEHSDALGFEYADLEWESPKGLNSVPADRKHVDSSKLPRESTPLLAEYSSRAQASLDPSPSALSLRQQGDMAVFALKDIDVRFPDGGLSLVAGPTGSGKSSLLSALIGEMTLSRGRIMLPTIHSRDVAARESKYRDVIKLSGDGLAICDIAYVSQEAWLRNATIRENILFGEPYNQERYEEVLRVCAMKPDLRILPAGDLTEIGERGITLSGGQKQRVALARAVYSSRRILLIDDCLSAVDSHTGKHILMECLLSKTKLMQGRTRVLVTHHVAMCLPYAQYIVMMHEGRITLKGTPADLQNQTTLSKALAELESGDSDATTRNSKKHERSPASEVPTDNRVEDIALLVNDMKSEDEYNARRLRTITENQTRDPNGNTSVLQGTLVDEEEREEGRVEFRVWKVYISACGSKWFWIRSFFLMLLWQGVVILQDYWVRVWVAATDKSSTPHSLIWNNTESTNAPTSDDMAVAEHAKHHSVAYWLGIYVLIGFGSIVWRIFHLFVVYRGSIRGSRKIHSQLLQAIVHATPRFFDSTPIGRIISRFSHDMDVIDDSIMDTMMELSSNALAVFTVYVIMSTVAPVLILVALFVSLLYAGIGAYYLNTSREIKRLKTNSMSPLLSLFSELTQGVSTVRAFGAKHYYIQEAINRMGAHMRPFSVACLINRWIGVRVDIASTLISFSCALFIISNLDWIDAGLAGFALSYALTFSERMIWLIRNYGDNELNMNAVERVVQYLDIEQEAPLESDPENKPSTLWPRKGDVQIKNLAVEYVPGVPVLHDISLSAKHGEKIGVVGRTGAGKSTMSLALLRYIEASKGRIVLDGVDISKIGLEDLRRNVTIIPQDPVLFNGTIRFNLDPFDEHPDELLWDALKRTHLVRERESQTTSTAASITEGASDEAPMLERMAGIFTSLDAEIKANGQNLSLGQRQLVALARALVRRSKLIIMDEATASVDFDTDNRIQRTIRGPEFANSTLFCIAHRLRTIIDYDQVLVLDKGKVAEFDTPYNLLQNDNGIFRSMCEKSGEYEHLLAAANATTIYRNSIDFNY
ncbi:hypothetical protein IW138_003829 [Coemansia sp. RSA 986]|nr:hypothetical protein IW138_003829 [Coemansia sp. RSA 986]